ncbi:MAG TPA: ABC transporter ATP-binding protein [Gaiellaceae bacterium]|jgi:cobalamin transport system ATP-binding protein|nr:ABC transporter ATP-binding protein [Gaiellaceae bacterium]
MLRVEDIRVSLEGVEVVKGVGLHLDEGEWLGLIGPNGAGKTTVLRAVAGLVPYSGSIRIAGDETSGLRRRELARRVAVVPQIPIIPPDTSVLEYVVLGRTPHLGYSGSPGVRDVTAARSALARLDAAHLGDRRLGSLSGGERQRAVLARAVAQDARLLLLDEPTSALDVGAQQQVLELVASLRVDRGLTVLSAMHDLTHAGQYADRLVLMDGGREVAEGTPKDVLTEQLVARHYGADVRVIVDPETGIAVVPLRPRVASEEPVT